MSTDIALQAPWLNALRARLAARGFDVCHVFAAQRYNAERHDKLSALDTFGHDSTLSLLVGNTRALWTPLIAQLTRAVGECGELPPHPVDSHAAESIADALTHVPVQHRVYLGPEEGGEVSLVLAAATSGFAVRAPCHLAVHPELGSWFGLRAVVTFDLDLEVTPLSPSSPCDGCPAPCMQPFRRAQAAYLSSPGRRVADDLADWVAVRDACPVGTAYRYEADQLHYHYTKDRDRLLRVVRARTPEPRN